ncbi:hypothetical protein [Halobacillus salinus]|uniref:hypothetical protein n=1 Tax=Halobacillus salinus TaxID=192814 RepID=UPI001592A657|nr:hypothetical protein [Halobacillus salinus]
MELFKKLIGVKEEVEGPQKAPAVCVEEYCPYGTQETLYYVLPSGALSRQGCC